MQSCEPRGRWRHSLWPVEFLGSLSSTLCVPLPCPRPHPRFHRPCIQQGEQMQSLWPAHRKRPCWTPSVLPDPWLQLHQRPSGHPQGSELRWSRPASPGALRLTSLMDFPSICPEAQEPLGKEGGRGEKKLGRPTEGKPALAGVGGGGPLGRHTPCPS